MDISKYFRDRDASLDDAQWHEVLLFSYSMAESAHKTAKVDEETNRRLDCLVSMRSGGSSSSSSASSSSSSDSSPRLSTLQIKLRGLLHLLLQLNAQHRSIDGLRNVWVIKAPESSCGKGVKLFYRLQEILDCERGMGGRSVQKYLELPLLAPRRQTAVTTTSNTTTSTTTANNSNSGLGASSRACSAPTEPQKAGPQRPGHRGGGRGATPKPSMPPLQRSSSRSTAVGMGGGGSAKFDLRVWALVTSFRPLRAFVYSHVYGEHSLHLYLYLYLYGLLYT